MNEADLLDRVFVAPDAKAVEVAEQRVLARYRREPAAPRRRMLLTAVLGLAAAAAVIVLALEAGRSSDSTAGAGSLAGLARIAGGQALPPAGTYSYLRIQSDFLGEDAFDYHMPATTETWRSASGDLVQCTQYGEFDLVSAKDRRAWVAAGSPDYARDLRGSLVYSHWRDVIPSLAGRRGDRLPATLGGISRLVARQPYIEPGDLLYQVQRLFLWGHANPRTRSAVFRYLATVNELSVVPGARTHGGRPGLGISVAGDGESDSVKVVLIFDPSTSRLIGFRDLPLARSATRAGGDKTWADYLSTGSVRLVTTPPHTGAGGSQPRLNADARRPCSDLPRP
jgi:hypothetical protein